MDCDVKSPQKRTTAYVSAANVLWLSHQFNLRVWKLLDVRMMYLKQYKA